MLSEHNIEAISILRNSLESNGIIKHCHNCSNSMQSNTETLCGLSPESGQPPPNILIYGCGQWDFECPF